MGLYKTLDQDLTEVDVIIAGGGTAGCIVAGRLAEADPSLSILVIEGGKDNYADPTVVTPAMFPIHLRSDSKTALFYKAIKSNHLANREVIVPSGGILGGGSSINFMIWNMPGWTADELLPFFRKLETYSGQSNAKDHGFDGPIQVSDGTLRLKNIEDEFIAAANEIGYPTIPDLNVLDTNNGVALWKRFVSPDGKRSDTAHAYLHPRLRDGRHPNLHVLVESQVVRVLFDENKRACGVEYRQNPIFQAPDASNPPPKNAVRARKLVVVSCGACGSPSVLERSGVGSKTVLDKAGVKVVEELPGVGHDYQDHHLMMWPYKSSFKPHETLDELFQGRQTFQAAFENKDPRLGWNIIDVAAKVRPTDEEVIALGPEFRKAWDRDFKDKPNRPLMLMALLNAHVGDPAAVEPGPYATMGTFSAYPYSRGHIHITGPEVGDTLDFNAGFLSDKGDVDIKKHVWAYKKTRELIRRMSVYRGEVAAFHPPFPANSKAALSTGDANFNGADKIQDLDYSSEDDAILEAFLRESINTTWHSLGTNKMAPREDFGVVDAQLSVYGVSALKVVDLSIAPSNVAANTNNTALAIGEKGAAIIIQKLGLSK
ncbi:GMC oxidoreductase [Xylariaceae sp. FL0255]|nr:GMC oxidoreductase [Xylariaceae sp. FL0255]